MAETKPKQANSLRTPKPKKLLGLTVPPALRLPHEDLIGVKSENKPTSLTSQTSQTSNTEALAEPFAQTNSIASGANTSPLSNLTEVSHKHQAAISDSQPILLPSLPSQTSLTRQTGEQKVMVNNSSTTLPVSPQRDFTKFANSINREAVPRGLFTGKSKQLYDCLYSLTRGAFVPTRSVRISRPRLMKQANIGSRVTFDANIERLVSVGLLSVRQIIGEHDGNEYSVLLPEEILAQTMPSQTSPTSQASMTSPAQNLDRLVGLETSLTRHTLSPIKSTISDESKTSFKTKEEKFDDEAFAQLTASFKRAVIEVTGKGPNPAEAGRWEELAEILITELKIAAGRTTVSSVPSFLAEHLRRRLWKKEKRQLETESAQQPATQQPQQVNTDKCPDCFGTGMYYPDGFDKGVAKCAHANLKVECEN